VLPVLFHRFVKYVVIMAAASFPALGEDSFTEVPFHYGSVNDVDGRPLNKLLLKGHLQTCRW